MENSENKSSCGCGDNSSSGCCESKPKSNFSKIIFIVVIVAALGIIGFKAYNNSAHPQNASVCTQDSTKGSCCSKSSATCDKK